VSTATICGMSFEVALRRWTGPAAWVFAAVPDDQVVLPPGPFGRVPVVATVDDVTWSTSVWRDREHGWLLAVPARVRRGKDDGDTVVVSVTVDASRL
jgi:hypothetical protein